MAKKKSIKKDILKRGKNDSCSSGNGGGCAYGLGVVGAAVYYISVASGFWMGVLGILKALAWPAFLVFELLKFIGA